MRFMVNRPVARKLLRGRVSNAHEDRAWLTMTLTDAEKDGVTRALPSYCQYPGRGGKRSIAGEELRQ
ncbi:hypothetical protein BD626DRAFT_511870 [Schizophyllum amplum]|uniref:Uncharacterized protein n=1 Tax=Schizophyllum amplum TaxID=97359 RepID=A0A550C0W2_9AGAR|nr:hypothetical protein BD626DRAFT_511870 [Auriculariopsis ampla]